MEINIIQNLLSDNDIASIYKLTHKWVIHHKKNSRQQESVMFTRQESLEAIYTSK